MARAQARPPIGRTTKRSLNFLQEGFEADGKTDPGLTDQRRQFEQGDVGDCQAVRTLARVIDCGSCLLRDLILVKRQPDDHVRIDENHLRLPHSSAEIAGETTSPTTVPFPSRKL